MQSVPIFDAEQFGRRTLGNPAMQVEILSLFATESARLLRQVELADDPQVRSDRLHALAALARNTGAARLAHAARELETQIAREAVDLQPLRAVLSDTLAYVTRVQS